MQKEAQHITAGDWVASDIGHVQVTGTEIEPRGIWIWIVAADTDRRVGPFNPSHSFSVRS